MRQREERFHNDVMSRFEHASVHLATATEVLASVVDPLAQVYALAWRHRLPLPRLLIEVPKLQEAVRILTAMANAGVAAPAAADDEL
jgi:hypothetical protein